MITKTCNICKSVLTLEKFNKNSTKADGRNSICKNCCKEQKRQKRKELKEFESKYLPI